MRIERYQGKREWRANEIYIFIAVYVRWFYKESECPLFIGQMFLASKYV